MSKAQDTQDVWRAWCVLMARSNSKFFIGTATPPRGYQKRARLRFRKQLKNQFRRVLDGSGHGH